MGKRRGFRLEKIDDGFIIKKNVEFEYLIRSTYDLYEKLIKESGDEHMNAMWNDDIFSALIIKLLDNNIEVELSLEETMWLKDWIDTMCKIILEFETADFKNNYTLKYFKSAEKFVEEIKINIPEIK